MKVRGYIFSRKFFGERVPQHVQNLVIRDYCLRNRLEYLLSATEYAMEDSHLIFQQVLNDLDSIDGIALYSLFQLPKETDYREKIYTLILKKSKQLHFAVEGLKITNEVERDRVEILWKLKLVTPENLNL